MTSSQKKQIQAIKERYDARRLDYGVKGMKWGHHKGETEEPKKGRWKNASTEETYSAAKKAYESKHGKVSDEDFLKDMTGDARSYLEDYAGMKLRDWNEIEADIPDENREDLRWVADKWEEARSTVEDATDTIREFLNKSDAELYEAMPKFGEEEYDGEYFGEPYEAYDAFDHGWDRGSVEKAGGDWGEIEGVIDAIHTLSDDDISFYTEE